MPEDMETTQQVVEEPTAPSPSDGNEELVKFIEKIQEYIGELTKIVGELKSKFEGIEKEVQELRNQRYEFEVPEEFAKKLDEVDKKLDEVAKLFGDPAAKLKERDAKVGSESKAAFVVEGAKETAGTEFVTGEKVQALAPENPTYGKSVAKSADEVIETKRPETDIEKAGVPEIAADDDIIKAILEGRKTPSAIVREVVRR